MPRENLHITLAFLGSVREADIGALEVSASQVAYEVGRTAVRIALDRIEYWKKGQLLCATARNPSDTGAVCGQAAGHALTDSADGAFAVAPALADSCASTLAEALKSRLVASGFAPDPKPFRPHVTLARKVPHRMAAQGLPVVHWSFNDFALVDSRTEASGSVYTVLKSFSLGRR